MIITKYNAICNLGDNIEEVFNKALNGDAGCFELRNSRRLGCINSLLEEIKEENYNTRANQVLALGEGNYYDAFAVVPDGLKDKLYQGHVKIVNWQ